MSKDPAVLFYTSDFLTGTMLMSYEQKGKYITLLCLQHQKNFLTEKDMINICSSYDKDIYDKFKKEGDTYFNERMKFEHEKRANFSKSRSKNRLKGLKKNKLNKKSYDKDMINISNSYDNHMENENININISNNNSYNIEDIKRYFKEKGYSEISAQKFYDYYSIANWKDSKGKKVKNWKQKAQAVWFKDENKIVDDSKIKMVW
jgi:hypothetical protein